MRNLFLAKIVILFLCILICVDLKVIGFTQVTRITSWWPSTSIAKSIGVPGYANTEYNYFTFGIWTCSTGIGPMAVIY